MSSIQKQEKHEHLYMGDASECCNAPVREVTDGDADWQECTECGEPCNTTCPKCRTPEQEVEFRTKDANYSLNYH